jgi:hypothetical protein
MKKERLMCIIAGIFGIISLHQVSNDEITTSILSLIIAWACLLESFRTDKN